MAKDFFTLSLPVSCTYCIPGIYALDESDARSYAAALFRSHRPKVGRVRKPTVYEEDAYVNKTDYPKDAASKVSRNAWNTEEGHVYDVELIVYGYYVFNNVTGRSREEASERIIENLEEMDLDTGELDNPQASYAE